VLKTSTGLAAGALFAEPVKGAAPPPTGVTPALVEAARKEGKLSYYCALELNVGERLARTFEAKYPGIAVRVERSGAERIFQRIAQEQASGINAVDVANSTDPAHYLDWKAKDWLAPYVPDDVAKHFPADHVDPDGLSREACPAKGAAGAVGGRPAEKAPAGGTGRDGRRQRLQSVAAEGPGPAGRGRLCDRRLTAHHCSQWRVPQRAESECGAVVPEFFFSSEGQQLLVDNFAHRSFHAQVKEKAGHPPLSTLKLLKSDPAAVLAQSEEIKARYGKLFKV